MALNGPARAAVAAGVAAVAFLGIGAGVMAVGDNGEPPAGSTTTSQEVRPVADPSTNASTTSAAPVTDAPAATIAPAAEVTPGLALPEPPPAPTPENPTVSTVMGPYGPVYPDGYTEDTGPKVPPSLPPPVRDDER